MMGDVLAVHPGLPGSGQGKHRGKGTLTMCSTLSFSCSD